jgi:hypothetical protein
MTFLHIIKLQIRLNKSRFLALSTQILVRIAYITTSYGNGEKNLLSDLNTEKN